MVKYRYAVFACNMCGMFQIRTNNDTFGGACTHCNEGSASFIGFMPREEILKTAERIKQE